MESNQNTRNISEAMGRYLWRTRLYNGTKISGGNMPTKLVFKLIVEIDQDHYQEYIAEGYTGSQINSLISRQINRGIDYKKMPIFDHDLEFIKEVK